MSSLTPAGSGGAPLEVTTSPSGSEIGTVANVEMESGGTEYSFQLPSGTRQFVLKLRENKVLQVSYQENESGSIFTRVPPGAFLSEAGLLLTAPVSIYFQSPDSDQIAEIRYWI